MLKLLVTLQLTLFWACQRKDCDVIHPRHKDDELFSVDVEIFAYVDIVLTNIEMKMTLSPESRCKN